MIWVSLLYIFVKLNIKAKKSSFGSKKRNNVTKRKCL